ADSRRRTALVLAAARGRSVTVALLQSASAGAPVETIGAASKTARAAIGASLAALQRSNSLFLKRTGCFSCHHQGLGLMVTGVAQDRGFATDKALTRAQVERIAAGLGEMRPMLLKAARNPAETKNVPLAELGD